MKINKNTTRISLFLFLSMVCFLNSQALLADDEKKELIGQLSISDILIQPRFISTKERSASFDLDRSYFFFSWKMDKSLSAHFGVGELGLMNQNARIKLNSPNTTNYKNVSFFEAYGQLDTKFGTVRAGIVPLMFGWEGGRRESDWIFPRTLFYGGEDASYQTQNFGMRDYGVQYDVSYKNYYTYVTVHNGENGPDQDGKVWVTSRVGWKDPSGIELAAAFSNGKFQATTSSPVNKFSYGNFFGTFEFYNLLILLEGYVGRQQIVDVVSTPAAPNDLKFWDVHLDLSHPITKSVTGLFRLEQYDPNSTVQDDRQLRYILGAELSNELRTSNLYLWFIRNAGQGGVVSGNEVMLAWKVRSLSIF